MLGVTLIIFQAMNPILASMIVPGGGELILGEKTKAQVFFVTEAAIWFSYFGYNYAGYKIDYSARAFAVQHSLANSARRDDAYFNALEKYLSSADYNLMVEREASYIYSNDPQKQQEYIKENGYFGQDEWQWDTLSNFSQYWKKRKASRENFRRASFMTGFAIINRIISVIDVAFFSQKERFGLDTNPGRIGIYYKF